MAPLWLNEYHIVFWKFIKQIIFWSARALYGLVQTLYWTYNGTLKELHESKKPENYEKSVQVMDIVCMYQFDLLRTLYRSDFVLTHNRFESPQYIFDNDHITLLTLEEGGAIFVEALPGQQLWKSEFNSFYRLAQIENAQRLLFVPNSTFLKMADKLGDPKETVVLVHTPGRCGSTMFLRMMEVTGVCLTQAESDVFNKITVWQKRGETEELKKITRATMAWLCRPIKGFDKKAAVMKISATCIFSIRFLAEVFPKAKHVFVYREVEKSCQSMYRMAQEFPLAKIAFTLSKYTDKATEALFASLGLTGEDYRMKAVDDIDFSIFMWANVCNQYMKLYKSGFPTVAIRYEDIVKNRLFSAEAILEYIGLSKDLAPLAVTGLDVDSQKNSPYSQEKLSRHMNPPLTPGALRRANDLMKKYGLPLVNSGDGYLDGTITRQKK